MARRGNRSTPLPMYTPMGVDHKECWGCTVCFATWRRSIQLRLAKGRRGRLS